MGSSESGHRALVAIHASRGPGRRAWVVGRTRHELYSRTVVQSVWQTCHWAACLRHGYRGDFTSADFLARWRAPSRWLCGLDYLRRGCRVCRRAFSAITETFLRKHLCSTRDCACGYSHESRRRHTSDSTRICYQDWHRLGVCPTRRRIVVTRLEAVEMIDHAPEYALQRTRPVRSGCDRTPLAVRVAELGPLAAVR